MGNFQGQQAERDHLYAPPAAGTGGQGRLHHRWFHQREGDMPRFHGQMDEHTPADGPQQGCGVETSPLDKAQQMLTKLTVCP